MFIGNCKVNHRAILPRIYSERNPNLMLSDSNVTPIFMWTHCWELVTEPFANKMKCYRDAVPVGISYGEGSRGQQDLREEVQLNCSLDEPD
ncbi:hypothetical protein R75465_07073 [Paraburkholderia aspalathi]|nr:hypothetical protein R75465_07073 [Paraburkholderia aspalathi]